MSLRPVLTRSKSSPLIIVRSKREFPVFYPAGTFTSSGYCDNCGERFSWEVVGLSAALAESDEEFERKQRALSLWFQYKKKRWCPKCVPGDARHFIAAQANGVVYR